MNIGKIEDGITKILVSNSSKVSLFIIEKLDTKDGLDYISHKPSLDLELQKEIIKVIKPTLSKIKNTEQIEFNENGRPNGVVEWCKKDYVGVSLERLLNSLKEDMRKEKLIDSDKKDIYCIRIEIDSGEYVYFLNRIPQLRKFEKGIWGRLVDSTFKKTTNAFIGIEPNFDLIIYQEEILVVNNVAMQRIFDLRTKYIENANSVLSSFEDSEKIEGFEQFKMDSIEDGNVVKRVSRLMEKPERMTRFIDNFDKVEQIIIEFDLNIELNAEKTKIKYTDKKQLNDIVKLLNDAYYKTVLSGEKGVDELR
ncbi:DUF4868 domain-containing protein [Amphibacillus xylanus]|uniref:DUF4868 domain-containing protein n=1 Tax=Amphibacillus xylanus (strain ATCC 51415 / DSM 6626 / JCM 7361 / LMG 17667 / NBRC 15112 / Ep01) TaxID=698758 RepID=K0IVC0_AMPXN|nr:DUF4868 domain-containing protein [Amphibacillus xylanus]BAM46335.1 hypothetical protein AXY_02030 [Amphibacillus xylanus NBRC 15112]